MNDSWKQDPRVKAMPPGKIEFLIQLTSQLDRTPKKQLLPKFLSLTMEAKQKGISFSDQETAFLVEILSGYMKPEDRQKLETLRILSQKLADRGAT